MFLRTGFLRGVTVLSFVCLLGLLSQRADGDRLLPGDIEFVPYNLEIRRLATLPSASRRIISMTTQPGDSRLFVSSQEGRVHAVASDGTVAEWFDIASAITAATGRGLGIPGNAQGGLRAIAFHPDFETNGKLYASFMEDRPANPDSHHYLGNSAAGAGVAVDSVVAEFTYGAGVVDPASYRELFRIALPQYGHSIKQLKFNKFAEPGDEDHGLLYIGHGDGGTPWTVGDGGLNLDDALGKLLRVNPLQSGTEPYTTPGSPFAGEPNALDEIYAYGLRNPHNLSFAQSDGPIYLIVADIGHDNIEEVNLIRAGGNYGWSDREGTFVHKPTTGYISGVEPLPVDDAANSYVYPAAQYDHDTHVGDTFAAVAIVGGHVLDSPVYDGLRGHYIYGNFAGKDGNGGEIYVSGFQEMVETVTELDPSDPNRDHPDELTWATTSQVRIAFDHDDDPASAPMVYDDLAAMFSGNRPDTRMGIGLDGELYISSKYNGTIYVVTGVGTSLVPEPAAPLLLALASGLLVGLRRR